MILRSGKIAVACVITILASGCDLFDSSDPTSNCEPEQIMPAEGAVLDNGCFDQSDGIRWEFSWAPCDEADSFHLYVIGPSAITPVVDRRGVQGTAYTHVANAWIADAARLGWTWRVRARIRGELGPWSPERTFDVEPRDTDCP